MAIAFTGMDIGRAALRAAQALVENKDRFNKLDAAGGDGDMGTTLANVSQALLADEAPYPGDVGESLMRIVRTISKTSGSSLSAVVMVGLMALGKAWSSKSQVSWLELAPALSNALETMQLRSKARLGDKTVLDGIALIAGSVAGLSTTDEVSDAAAHATARALAEFHGSPAVIGRLRLEPSRGIGADDPGMVALQVAVSAMAAGPTIRVTAGFSR